ncbi:MAG: CotH kinase family protein, partial [Muribaculum sp.]|nr:CotH kinase family protein [Muribaculum sp.]
MFLTAMSGAYGAHNMWLLPATANQLVISHTPGSEVYALATTGADPFVSMSNLERPLASSERVLTFEYVSTKATGHIELFFHYPATAGISKVYAGLPAASSWRTATFDISEPCAQFAWGAAGDQLRIDFGNVASNNLQVRNIRISSPGDNSYVPRTDVFGLENVLSLGFPVVEITTDGGEEPTYDPVSPPEGSIGAGIANVTKVPGRVRVLQPDGSVAYDSGEYEKSKSGMTVKVRGNTSAYTPKKPYKIKLQKKTDMLGSGNKDYYDKNWVLLKDEEQLLRNGFKMCELSEQQWAPRSMYVNVVFNGQFRGFYLLAEGVERNTTGRLNVDEDGFIAEMDAYWWNEGGAYFSSERHPIHNYTLKYPDYEDLTAEQKEKIQMYLTQFEASVWDGTYPQYIDVASFAGWLVAHDMLGTLDSAGSNMLLTRYDLKEETPIRMGNLWDFDSTESMTNEWSNVHTHNFPKYFDSPNKLFVEEYVHAFYRLNKKVFSGMMKFVTDFQNTDAAAAFERSLNLDNEKWTTKNHSGAYCTKRSVDWYTNRWGWMTNAVAQMAVTTGIEGVSVDSDAKVGISVNGNTIIGDGHLKVYDPTGRCVAEGDNRVSIPANGLYM